MWVSFSGKSETREDKGLFCSCAGKTTIWNISRCHYVCHWGVVIVLSIRVDAAFLLPKYFTAFYLAAALGICPILEILVGFSLAGFRFSSALLWHCPTYLRLDKIEERKTDCIVKPRLKVTSLSTVVIRGSLQTSLQPNLEDKAINHQRSHYFLLPDLAGTTAV